MGFAATSVLFFLSVLGSWPSYTSLGAGSAHLDSKATTAVKDFMLVSSRRKVQNVVSSLKRSISVMW
jgi:hypothetical protein